MGLLNNLCLPTSVEDLQYSLVNLNYVLFSSFLRIICFIRYTQIRSEIFSREIKFKYKKLSMKC